MPEPTPAGRREMDYRTDHAAHDRALDASEANADAAIAAEAAERAQWLKDNDHWLRADFMELHAELFASYQQAQWQEYVGGEA